MSVVEKTPSQSLVANFLYLLIMVLSMSVIGFAEAKPSVMVLIEEKNIGAASDAAVEALSQAEITLIQRLRQAGYQIVDAQTLKNTVETGQGLGSLVRDNRRAAEAGLDQGAELMLLGTSVSKPGGIRIKDSQLQSIRATVSARMIDNKSVRVLASGMATAARPHIDEQQGGTIAIEFAANDLADSLIARLEANNRRASAQAVGADTEVNISGLASFRHLDALMTYLETQVEQTDQVVLNHFSAGTADISVKHQGGGRAIASAVSDKQFDGFRLELRYVGSTRVELMVVTDPTAD